MLKKANIEDIEIGNLLFGNSRGKYVVPSEWQKDFYPFLEKCDLDDSVINEDKYKNDKRYNASEIVDSLKEEIADTMICIRIMQDITGISDSEIEEEVRQKDNRNVILCRKMQLIADVCKENRRV